MPVSEPVTMPVSEPVAMPVSEPSSAPDNASYSPTEDCDYCPAETTGSLRKRKVSAASCSTGNRNYLKDKCRSPPPLSQLALTCCLYQKTGCNQFKCDGGKGLRFPNGACCPLGQLGTKETDPEKQQCYDPNSVTELPPVDGAGYGPIELSYYAIAVTACKLTGGPLGCQD
jgi:hypothetical protein